MVARQEGELGFKIFTPSMFPRSLSTRQRFRTEADYTVDAGEFARKLDAAESGAVPAEGVELPGRFGQVGDVFAGLVAALRIGAERPQSGSHC